MSDKNIFVKESNQGVRLLFLLAISLCLMLADYNYPKFSLYKDKVSVIFYPLYKISSFPFDFFSSTQKFFYTRNELLNLIDNLEQQIYTQQAKNQKLDSLEKENNILKGLLNSYSQKNETMLHAKIMKIDPDPFIHNVIVDKGYKNNVYKDQVAIDQSGIIGRVIAINKYTAKVVLITDASQVVPVENIRTGVRSNLYGTGNIGVLILKHVPNTSDVKEGDLLVSSGLGGIFPAGYHVGKVSKVNYDPNEPFAEIEVNPSAKIDSSKIILLVNYEKNSSI